MIIAVVVKHTRKHSHKHVHSETNPCKTPGCQRAPAFDGKKCPEFKNGKKHPDRCFKETGKTVDECAAICSKDAACNFFSHPKEASGWCIGCKVAPSAKHPGAISYAQTTTGSLSLNPNPNPPKFEPIYETQRKSKKLLSGGRERDKG